ncbi:MAG TPA: hypothetical protein VGC93_18505 [Thermoanaerobaculia bacterium]
MGHGPPLRRLAVDREVLDRIDRELLGYFSSTSLRGLGPPPVGVR